MSQQQETKNNNLKTYFKDSSGNLCMNKHPCDTEPQLPYIIVQVPREITLCTLL